MRLSPRVPLHACPGVSLRSTLRAFLRASLGASALAGLVVTGLAVPSASGASVYDQQLPFGCGEEWTGTTRSNHRPSEMSVDFNRDGDIGDLVVSTAPGVVTRVADTGSTSYGRYVVVDHGDGLSTLYAHLKRAWVDPGQRLDQGSVIGLVGESGGVTGAHLHFEQRLEDEVHHPYFSGVAYQFGSTVASLNCPDVPLAGDWDGDGQSGVGVFRRLDGQGMFRLSLPDGSTEVDYFGRSSDVPVVGDWDGDGRTDVGVRRQGRRTFLLRHSDGTWTSVRFGRRADVPVVGDWNGDGLTDVGIWRARRAVFRLLVAPGVVEPVRLGAPGVQPVTGDWNGDGRTDVGVHDPATATFTLRVATSDGTEALSTVSFGSSTDLPVTGDWDGDGLSDVGVWTPSTATYSLRPSSTMARTQPGAEPANGVIRQRFGRRR